MRRATPPRLLAPLLLSLLAAGCGREPGSPGLPLPPLPARPSILLLTVDTLRADHLSSYGYRRPTSPVLDRLAAEGVRFTLAQTQWPKTGPAFASMLTATYPKDNGNVREIGTPVPCTRRLLAEELLALGYQTRAVVANGAVGREFFFDQGFEEFAEAWKGAKSEPEIEVATRAGHVTDLALEQLERVDPARPLFLWVHYLDPHMPYAPPEDARDRFQDDGAFPPGPKIEIDRSKHRRVTGAIGRSQVIDGRDELDFYVARYDAEIAYADREIGRLLEGLRARGLYDRMLTVFTADHGESLGDHDYYFDHGMLPFQDSMRVPLAIRWPGAVPAGVDVHAVELLHLAPTLLEAAGKRLEGGRWAQGTSLLPRLLGRASGEGTLAYSEAGQATRRKWTKAVTDGRFKLIWVPTQQEQRKVAGVGVDFALYDLEADPGETTNVADRHPEVVERLQRKLWTWFEATPFQVDVDTEQCADRETAPETVEQLRALGYL
jgi:arylsulfatase A-like enzyme